MFKRGVVLGSGVVLLLATLWVGQVLSQQAPPPGGGRQPGQRLDPEQMRLRMTERMKEALGATDGEWKVLGPRVEKVQTLSSQLRGGMGFGRMFTGRTPRREAPEGTQPTPELTDVEKALQELRTVLENEEAKPAEIKKGLTDLRKAREKVKQELAKAQKELRELLSVRQEAQLVLMGLLD